MNTKNARSNIVKGELNLQTNGGKRKLRFNVVQRGFNAGNCFPGAFPLGILKMMGGKSLLTGFDLKRCFTFAGEKNIFSLNISICFHIICLNKPPAK